MRFLLWILACSSSSSPVVDAGPPAAACLLNACAGAQDCPMGTRCNSRLQPPRCETLYCGADGTICDDSLLCIQGSICVGGACYSHHTAAELGVGDPCVIPSQPLGAEISEPALECPSRLCLIEPVAGGNARATCTRSCTTDDDCAGSNTSQCANGFVCAVATQTGAHRCQKFCACADDIQPAPSCT